MRYVKNAAVGALVVMSLVGCHKVTYVSDKPMGTETHTGGQSFFILGLAGSGEINVPEICPNGMSKLVVYQSFVDGFLGALTMGIYTPRSFEMTCSKGN